MKFLPCLQLMLLLAFLQNIPSMPIRDLTEEDWNHFLQLIEKSNNTSSNNYKHYVPYSLNPFIMKMEFYDKLKRKNFTGITAPKLNKSNTPVSFEKEPEETNFWTSVKYIFTNDINNFAKDVADNYNPIPSIISIMNDVKRSDTWTDVKSFFTKGYIRLIKLSETVLEDLKKFSF